MKYKKGWVYNESDFEFYSEIAYIVGQIVMQTAHIYDGKEHPSRSRELLYLTERVPSLLFAEQAWLSVGRRIDN